jgi:hypothetical protein
MRILISTSTFPHELDAGLPRFVNDLAEALSELMEVTVLAPDSPGAAKTEQVAKVDVRRFTYFRPRRLQRLALGQGMRDNLRASWLARVQVPAYLAKQAFETRRLIRRGGFDLVFAHWIVPQGLTAAWAVGRARRVFSKRSPKGGQSPGTLFRDPMPYFHRAAASAIVSTRSSGSPRKRSYNPWVFTRRRSSVR